MPNILRYKEIVAVIFILSFFNLTTVASNYKDIPVSIIINGPTGIPTPKAGVDANYRVSVYDGDGILLNGEQAYFDAVWVEGTATYTRIIDISGVLDVPVGASGILKITAVSRNDSRVKTFILVNVGNYNSLSPTPAPSNSILIKEITATGLKDASGDQYKIVYTHTTLCSYESIYTRNSDGTETLLKSVAVTANGDITDYINFKPEGEYITVFVVGLLKVDIGGTNVTNNGKVNGVANAYGLYKPRFTTITSERVAIPTAISRIYIDENSNGVGIPGNVSLQTVKFLKPVTMQYLRDTSKAINDELGALQTGALDYRSKTLEQIIAQSTSGGYAKVSANVVSISGRTTFGSATNPVTLIIDTLSIDSGAAMTVYGNLIITNQFNASKSVDITVNKVGGLYGNMYLLKNCTFNNGMLLNIQGLFYSKGMVFNQSANVTANKMVFDGVVLFNSTAQLTSSDDIKAQDITGNTSTTITSTNGDLIIENNLTTNGTLTITVGGRVAAGRDVKLNNKTVAVNAGGKTSSLILTTVAQPTSPVFGLIKSNEVQVIFKKGNLDLVQFNPIKLSTNQKLYYLGENMYIHAGINTPLDLTNVSVNISINNGTNVKYPVIDKAYIQNSSGSFVLSDTLVTKTGNSVNITELQNGTVLSSSGLSYIVKAVYLNSITGMTENKLDVPIIATISYTINGSGVTVKNAFTVSLINKTAFRMN